MTVHDDEPLSIAYLTYRGKPHVGGQGVYTRHLTKALVDLYNREYNSLVAPKYDGSYLTTPGISSDWSWRPHQSAVVARIIQAGNTYMAHEVGAGKTSAMIGAGMEMRRLGLVKKKMEFMRTERSKHVNIENAVEMNFINE